MNREQLRAVQGPLKERYRDDPDAALITLSAAGELGEGVSCSVQSGRALIERYESALPFGAWPNWVLGNHDRPRIATRVGRAQARVAAMLLLTLRGTPTIYYGDELGMSDAGIAPERVQDPFARWDCATVDGA